MWLGKNSKLITQHSKLVREVIILFIESPKFPLPRIHLLIRETEMVADLVQQGELDLVDQASSSGRL